MSLLGGLIKWRKAADGNDGPLWTLDDRAEAAPDGIAAQCCCGCAPCIITYNSVAYNLRTACKYVVTFTGLTSVFAPYNGTHIVDRSVTVIDFPDSACEWGLRFNDNDVMGLIAQVGVGGPNNVPGVVLSVNDAGAITIWGRIGVLPYPAWEGIGAHSWIDTDGAASQSASTCVVEEF
jgi:hypothetical protein